MTDEDDIVIPEDSAALIIDKDGRPTMLLPKGGDDEDVGVATQAIAALGLAYTHDRDLVAQLVQRMYDGHYTPFAQKEAEQ